jgi:hypothetical protein
MIKRILLVEDEEDNMHILRGSLKMLWRRNRRCLIVAFCHFIGDWSCPTPSSNSPPTVAPR